MKNKKSSLSPGFRTDIHSKFSKILFNKDTEFVCKLEDKYMKLALNEFLKDMNFKRTESDGNFVLVSTKMGVYKFYDKSPHETRVYDIPSEWDIFKMKIEKILAKNPIKEKDVSEPKSKSDNKKENESRTYLLDINEHRYYKGYFSYKGEIFVVDTYDNKVSIKDLSDNKVNDKKLFKNVTRNEIDIYSNKAIMSCDEKLMVYNSERDGELKSKNEIEIDQRKKELKSKGFIVLSDGKVVISDREKFIKNKIDEDTK